jgi:hypothetical protein
MTEFVSKIDKEKRKQAAELLRSRYIKLIEQVRERNLQYSRYLRGL